MDILLYENDFCLTNPHNFRWTNENYEHLCRPCLNTYANQSKLKEHMLRCIEHEVCNITYMHPNQKIKFNHYYMEIEPPV